MAEILVGRQPIFNRRRQVEGYELLYRGINNNLNAHESELNINKLILKSFADIGLENLAGIKPVYINFAENFLAKRHPLPFPPEKLIVEIPENILLEQPLIDACHALSEKGYTIVVNDVTSFEKTRPLLQISDMVKIDLTKIDRFLLNEMIQNFKEYSQAVLVENVETDHDFKVCRAYGVDLFQGYFLCKPNIVRGGPIESSMEVILESLALLQNPLVDFREIEKIINNDVTISYKLLKLVNSAFYSNVATIKTIGQAVSIIGLRQLSGWLTLLLIASVPNKPHELTTISLTRAKVCELLAKLIGEKDYDSYFLMGLFSILDALFDQPMSDIMKSILVSQEITDALIRHQGKMGQVLDTVLAIENANWPRLERLGIIAGSVNQSYIESLGWAHMIMQLIEKTE